MKKMRRIAALFLCLVMLIPTQGMSVLAETQQQAGSSYEINDTVNNGQEEAGYSDEDSSGEAQSGDSGSAGQDSSQEGVTENEGTESGDSVDNSAGNEAESGGVGEEGSETGEDEGLNESEGSEESGENGSGETDFEEPSTEESVSGDEKPSEGGEASKPSEGEDETGEIGGTGSEAEDGRVEETLPLEPIPPSEEDRIEETLPLDPIPDGTGAAGGAGQQVSVTLPLEKIEEEPEEPFIYWNPGNEVLVQLEDEIKIATGSNAEYAVDATDSDAEEASIAVGKDRADGLSPEKPVRTLKAAVKRAEKLADSLDMDLQDITIYAMNPMEVKPGDTEELKGNGINLASWPERSYDSDLIFYVNGGKLVLRDVNLLSGDGGMDLEDTALVRVDEGKVQLGAGVQAYGSFVLNYSDVKEAKEWEMATASEATSSDINETENQDMVYPVIELLNGFTAEQQFYLSILGGKDGQYEVVRSLFADELSEEEFLDMFSLSEYADGDWTLTVKEETEATVRNTEDKAEEGDSSVLRSRSAAFALAEVALTRKSLIATRAAGTPVYWNPGGAIEIGGVTYPGGQDGVNDGSSPTAPVKTWAQARAIAYSGVIICMQPIKLSENPDDYIGSPTDDMYVIDGGSDAPVTVKAWEVMPQPAFVLADGTSLMLKNVVLQGAVERNPMQLVVCDGGDLYLEEKVTTDYAYIQMILSDDSNAKDHPILVNDAESISVELYFTGIDDNINYRYLNVAEPYGTLLDEAAADPEAAGQKLMGALTINDYNSITVENGGKSEYAWTLRQDTDEDDNVAECEKLELYADFFYDAIYINGVSGDDRNYGANCKYPVKTFARAKEILEKAIQTSVTARQNAGGVESLLNKIAYPTKIYICDTVTVTGTENWNLSPGSGSPFIEAYTYVDYDGGLIQVKVMPCQNKNVECLVLIDGGKLTIENMFFTSNSYRYQKNNVILANNNSVLRLDKKAILSGSGVNMSEIGIELKNNSFMEMLSTWTGRIEKQGIGVKAQDSSIKMSGGEISENCSIDYYIDESEEQLNGAGVALFGNSSFTMEGGTIKRNRAINGAGIYLEGATDNKAVFHFIKGEITENIIGASKSLYKSGKGAGIYIGKNAKTIMESEAAITKQDAHYYANYGLGVYVEAEGEFEMNGGTISENVVTYSYAQGFLGGKGIGIYAEGKLSINGGTISGNGTMKELYTVGAAICINGKSETSIKNAVISNNYSGFCHDKSYGAIVLDSEKKSTISNCLISDNYGAYSGGGLSLGGNSGSEVLDCIIRNNSAFSGGGIDTTYSPTSKEYSIVDGCEIIDNIASNSGGGISSSAKDLIYNTLIKNNTARYGGGIYAGYIFTGTNLKILENHADFGGGIYFSGIKDVYLSDSDNEKTDIIDNNAKHGGGIYLNEYVNCTIDINGMLKNTVTGDGAQGNNLFVGLNEKYESSITKAEFRQPEGYNSEKGVYNIFMEGGILQLDPNKVIVEGDNHIYLNKTIAYLRYLAAPPDLNEIMPISVNDKVFKSGSTVIAYSILKNIYVDRISYDTSLNKYSVKSYSITFPEATYNAAENLNYSKGGNLPSRHQLGAYKTGWNYVSVVLVGQGVYLDGINGNDDNGGTSPADAVKTFTVAKRKLENCVDYANADSSDKMGFQPVIYICGQVNIGSSETWSLDYDEIRYKESKYVEYEMLQGREAMNPCVVRFAAYSGNMLYIGIGGNLELERIIIDGAKNQVKESVDSIVRIYQNGTLILNGDSQIQNNYGNGIDVSKSSNLIMNGDEKQKNEQISGMSGYGVSLSNAARLTMNGYSKIMFLPMESPRLYEHAAVENDSSTVQMNDHSMIIGVGNLDNSGSIKERSGIIASGNAQRTYMSDNARIVNCIYGISMSNGSTVIKGNSGITECHYAVHISGGELLLQECSRLFKNGSGVYSGSTTSKKIIMSDEAQITDNSGSGIQTWYGDEEASIELYDNASINSNEGSGISIGGDYYKSQTRITKITLGHHNGLDSPSIYDNKKNGIEYNAYFAGINKLELNANASIYGNSLEGVIVRNGDRLGITLNDQAWIGSNGYQGLKFIRVNAGSMPVWNDYQCEIVLNDEAAIGGLKERGNGKDGIYSEMPLDISLNDKSKISYNKSNGIYCTVDIDPEDDSKDKSDTVIQLTSDSSISNNIGDGIYCFDDTRPINRQLSIVMQSRSSILENSGNEQIRLASSAKLTIQEQSSIQAIEEDAIFSQGEIYLSGTATVSGVMNLRSGNKALTLLSPVASDSPKAKYYLNLDESYMGQIVVKPDNSGILDASAEIAYFSATAEGKANGKQLVAISPNIVLSGENNVYISGEGDDSNLGNSPSTPVRTFTKAKQLLETGWFTEGANIIVCGAVGIKEGDTRWSFGLNGMVTNNQTHDAWTPKVMRYSGYGGRMLEVTSKSMGAEATFYLDNIIIDGNSADFLNTYDGNQEMIYIGTGMTVILGNNAVLQNAKSSRSYTVGIKIDHGTLNIDGGVLRNLENSLENFSAIYTNGHVIDCTNYGTFNFLNGHIYDNSSNQSDIIRIEFASDFHMSGGIIEDNINRAFNGNIIRIVDASMNMKGGEIRNNLAQGSSAIQYYGSGWLILSGGRIVGNRRIDGSNAIGVYSPVYIGGASFVLQGGGCVIEDAIYLKSVKTPITVSNNIWQTTRRYTVYLNQGSNADQFKKGSVVVQPDNDMLTDASPYLQNFEVHSDKYILDRGQSETRSGGTIAGVMENKCLLLMQAVFIDSDNGNNNNTGLSPAQAVETFKKAVEKGRVEGEESIKDYYVIYASGPIRNSGGESWSMEEPAYVCRYTGFPVYGTNGEQIEQDNRAYFGQIVIPKEELTLENVRIYGRRSQDDIGNNGESLVYIPEGATVNMKGKSTLSRNYNIGNYMGENHFENLSSKGGAVYVDVGGTFNLEAGLIEETAATYGSAVFQAASETDAERFGRFKISNRPLVSGSIYLDGTSDITAAFIEPAENYIPGMLDKSETKLTVAMRNDYDGRPIVKYPGGYVPGYTQTSYYQLDDAIKAVYDVINRPGEANVLQLDLRAILYLDGENGNDSNDGSTPEQAVGSIRRIYEILRDGSNIGGAEILVSGKVKIDGKTYITNKSIIENNQVNYLGTYEDETGDIKTTSQVYFKRYVQPTAHGELEGYEVPTYKGSLLTVADGGDLVINGIYFDGHSRDTVGGIREIVAAGVEAEAPLLVVEEGGKVEVRKQEIADNVISTRNLFTNNVNIRSKDQVIGRLDGADITEGSSAGIEILGGECVINGCDFQNLHLGEGVSGGTDVYQFGKATIGYSTVFSGSVFLEGFGTAEEKQDTSHYLDISAHGSPVTDKFDVLIRDQYNGRTVAVYPDNGSGGASVLDIPYYRLGGTISDYYTLVRRTSNLYVFELNVPAAVYVDGVNGNDSNSGSNPKNPLQTMKQAYLNMQKYSTGIVYIVGEVTFPTGTEVTMNGNGYIAGTDKITLTSTDKVEIRRYIKPDFAVNPADDYAELFNMEDYLGELFAVKDGVTLNLGGNLTVDGHGNSRDNARVPEEYMVSHETQVNRPLIEVYSGGVLNLNRDAVLMDNFNTLESDGHLEGGAVANHGTTNLNGARLINNVAAKGAGIYQDGTFIITERPEGISGQEVYLTADTVEDRLIQTTVKFGDDTVLDVNMDNAVKGRDVVRFLTKASYAPNEDVDAEHIHFRLGSTVPADLFLVKALEDPEVLELQNWEILDVEVPEEIYLVVQKKGVKAASVANEMLESPVYKIRNRGIYDVNVSLTGFLNENSQAGITFDPMNLVGNVAMAVGDTDLYLSVVGEADGAFSAMGEVALDAFGTEEAVTQAFGRLAAGTEGSFTFKGTASEAFITKYMDSTFPYTGKTAEEMRQYIKDNARAKYRMTYKVELDPARR